MCFPIIIYPPVKIYRRHRRMRSSIASQKDYRLVVIVVTGTRFDGVLPLCHCLWRLTPSMPAVLNCYSSKHSAPYWSNPPFLISDIRALWLIIVLVMLCVFVYSTLLCWRSCLLEKWLVVSSPLSTKTRSIANNLLSIFTIINVFLSWFKQVRNIRHT